MIVVRVGVFVLAGAQPGCFKAFLAGAKAVAQVRLTLFVVDHGPFEAQRRLPDASIGMCVLRDHCKEESNALGKVHVLKSVVGVVYYM